RGGCPHCPSIYVTVPYLPVYRCPRIRFRSPQRGCDTRVPKLATVRAAPQLPAECVRASETFLERLPGKRTTRHGENRSLRKEFLSAKSTRRIRYDLSQL